jgi:hypothetical protein
MHHNSRGGSWLDAGLSVILQVLTLSSPIRLVLAVKVDVQYLLD